MIIKMKKTYIILIIVLMLTPWFSTLSYAQTELPFNSGEDMEFVIHYKWGVKADIAGISFTFREIKEPGKEPYFHLLAHASTYKFWDAVFKVRDIYESKFDTKTLMPIYFHRDIKEGNFWAKNWYNWSKDGMSLHTIVDKKGKVRRDTTFKEGIIIKDIINLFYSIRSEDFKQLQEGKKVFYTVAIDRNVADLMIRFVKKEEIKLQELGTYNAYKLAVSIKPRQKDVSGEESQFDFTAAAKGDDAQNVFYGEEKIYMWFSADDNKLPLFFSAPVAVGSINGRLSSYKGVKYPLKSLVTPAK